MRSLIVSSKTRPQRGAATVEFALIAIVFFMVLLGITEFGRIMYIWNTAQEVTRRAAREAAVRDFSAVEIAAIQRDSIFQGGTSGTVSLPAGAEITNATVRLVYLTVDAGGNMVAITAGNMPADPADNISACNDVARMFTSCIRFVEACIAVDNTCASSIPYQPMVLLLANLGTNLAINIPASSVVIPAESLGFTT
ncbi:MAG TPA: TadE family protein [Casimicrobiaceae bacterium]|jgi:Flp pilus assembly protein TadG|nr:TadE family protein [Casimicrobiaceae bacterium]